MRSNKLIFFQLVFWSCFFIQSVAFAESKKFGIGAILGAPTGISAAYSLGNNRSIDAAAGWSLGDDVNYHIHSTYLMHKPGAFEIDHIDIDIYFGIGARIKERDTDNKDEDFRFGARAPFGVHYMFDDPPVEIFGEIALILDVLEETDVDFNLGIGARFWF
ncbi:MAG: hypothetical protein KDD34_01815 [Bdellovibrionales bacterium]|nr:hypothetical protein [Bdellovibrionales bacterium]